MPGRIQAGLGQSPQAGLRPLCPGHLLRSLFGFPRNAFGSIDVTHDCNLRCKHCYFFEHDQPERALGVDEWVSLLATWRRTRSRWEFPFFQCSWVGGEPLLRPEVIERCRKFFRYNLVVTNGTLPLPDWPDVDFYVSIDGDEEVHEELRQRKGIYRQIKRNVLARGPGRVTISYCITRANAHCIEKMVAEWSPLASGFTFDFYTPMEGSDDPLWIPLDQRFFDLFAFGLRQKPGENAFLGVWP